MDIFRGIDRLVDEIRAVIPEFAGDIHKTIPGGRICSNCLIVVGKGDFCGNCFCYLEFFPCPYWQRKGPMYYSKVTNSRVDELNETSRQLRQSVLPTQEHIVDYLT